MVDTGDFLRKLGLSGKHDTRTKSSGFNENHSSLERNELFDHKTKSQALDFFGCNSDGLDSMAATTTNSDKETKAIGLSNDDQRGDPAVIIEGGNDEVQPSSRKKKKKSLPEKEKIVALRKEKVNQLRNECQIHVYGNDIPDPFDSFSNLKERFNCPSYILNNIEDAGYSKPTPVQMQAIPLLLNHRDSLVCAPTGSGKTLAFVIPILLKLKKPSKSGVRSLVIAPTRELANQIHREFSRLNIGRGFRINVLTKSRASSVASSKKSELQFDILITTPKRLVHLIQHDQSQIDLHKVEWLVLDEGDKLFEEGKNGFREQIASILTECDHPEITKILFSATLANQVEEWCSSHLNNFVKVIVGVRNSATENVVQELLFTGQETGKLVAVREVLRKSFDPPILIFVDNKDRAKELFNELIYDGLNVDVIHSDRTQAQRDNIVKCFRTGKIWVLIATELMGRGIDFKGVNLVINYDFPPSAVSYIHRIGRTGRAGRPGTAVTFFTEDDKVNLRSIANVIQLSGSEIPKWISQIPKPSRSKKRKLSNVSQSQEKDKSKKSKLRNVESKNTSK